MYKTASRQKQSKRMKWLVLFFGYYSRSVSTILRPTFSVLLVCYTSTPKAKVIKCKFTKNLL